MKNKQGFIILLMAISCSYIIEGRAGGAGFAGKSMGGGMGMGHMGGSAGFAGKSVGVGQMGGHAGFSQASPMSSFNRGFSGQSIGAFKGQNLGQASTFTHGKSFGGFDRQMSEGKKFGQQNKFGFGGIERRSPSFTQKGQDFGFSRENLGIQKTTPTQGRFFGPGTKQDNFGKTMQPGLTRQTEMKPQEKAIAKGEEAFGGAKPSSGMQPQKINTRQIEQFANKFQQPAIRDKTLQNVAQKTGKDVNQIKQDMQTANKKLDPNKVSAKGSKFSKFTSPSRLHKQKDLLKHNFHGKSWNWWWHHNRHLFFTLFPIYFYSLYNYYPPIYYDYYASYDYYPTAITYLSPILTSEDTVCMKECTQECLNNTDLSLNSCIGECRNRCEQQY